MAQQVPSQDAVTILRLPQVKQKTGLSRSLIYRLENQGVFPRRVPLGLRAVGWVESEVEGFLRARLASRATA